MSFKLGTFDTSDITGLKAILRAWPTLPVDLALDDLPAGDGSLYYQSRFTEQEWVFNLELTGSDLDDVMAKADQISQALNPRLNGLQDFTPNPAGSEWIWQGVLSQAIEWERDKVIWFSDQGVCRMAGTATITTPSPYGVALGAPEETTAPGGMSLTGGGNTSYHPIIEFRGVLSAAQSLTVGGTVVTGPLTAAQTMVLDFGEMDFYIKTTATGDKVRNVADRMTSFERLEGIGTISVPISISAGTFTKATGRVPARRI